MSASAPQVVVLSILTDGGPYRVGDRCSLAFVEPTIGRLVSHRVSEAIASTPLETIVPESVIGRVELGAKPYRGGALVALAFVDPTVVRIVPLDDRVHGSGSCDSVETEPRTPIDVTDAERPSTGARIAALPVPEENQERERSSTDERGDAPERTFGVEIGLEWTPQHVRRFVTIVDKLFAVERLGWYRHVLAMRLLVPNRISCGDASTDVEAMRHLHALRTALSETLGHPVLAAFMPNFTITAEWLGRIDSPTAARALADLRAVVAPFVGERRDVISRSADPSWTVGSIAHDEFANASPSSIETLLPAFVASRARQPELGDRLDAYRRALIDAFGQTAAAGESVRLGRMTEPNCALDDRLWHLVGAIGEAFADRADVA